MNKKQIKILLDITNVNKKTWTRPYTIENKHKVIVTNINFNRLLIK